MRGNKRAVVKIDFETGEIVEQYDSITEAGRKNFLEPSAIYNRCNGRNKRSPSSCGYEFAFADDEISLAEADGRIMKAKERRKKTWS